MPVLDVEIVTRPGETLSGDLAGQIAYRAGEVFGALPSTTWVKVNAIAADHYAENGNGLAEGIYPVFVSVLKAKLPPADEMRAEAALLASVVAQVCARPQENVHIIYQPEGVGRVAFGGRMVSG